MYALVTWIFFSMNETWVLTYTFALNILVSLNQFSLEQERAFFFETTIFS